MNPVERAIAFDCRGDRLIAVVALPELSDVVGVVIVVGGPQYRIGSHRQFVQLARALAQAGFPALRFDYRGMGDSEGEARSFESVSDDITAAIDALQRACPQVRKVVLWGLCDAASAALLHVDQVRDDRIKGVVLANPWVRAQATFARTTVKHYYASRLLDREFWKKLFSGETNVFEACKQFLRTLWTAVSTSGLASSKHRSFQDRMTSGMSALQGPALLVLSLRDLTAQEFVEYANTDDSLRRVLAEARIERCELADADHTFSEAHARLAVETATIGWLRRHFSEPKP